MICFVDKVTCFLQTTWKRTKKSDGICIVKGHHNDERPYQWRHSKAWNYHTKPAKARNSTGKAVHRHNNGLLSNQPRWHSLIIYLAPFFFSWHPAPFCMVIPFKKSMRSLQPISPYCTTNTRTANRLNAIGGLSLRQNGRRFSFFVWNYFAFLRKYCDSIEWCLLTAWCGRSTISVRGERVNDAINTSPVTNVISASGVCGAERERERAARLCLSLC